MGSLGVGSSEGRQDWCVPFFAHFAVSCGVLPLIGCVTDPTCPPTNLPPPLIVLLQYQGTLTNLPKSIAPSNERSSLLLTSFQPESDLIVAIERYRTGPFRPRAHVYESVRHERAPDVVFGIDLREWAGEGGWHAVRAGTNNGVAGMGEPPREDAIPWVVRGLLAGLDEGYKRLPNDAGAYSHIFSGIVSSCLTNESFSPT